MEEFLTRRRRINSLPATFLARAGKVAELLLWSPVQLGSLVGTGLLSVLAACRSEDAARQQWPVGRGDVGAFGGRHGYVGAFDAPTSPDS